MMLALSSASFTREGWFTPRKLRCFAGSNSGTSSRDSVPKAWPLLSESWVVALETSCGREGVLRIECEVDGRELRNPSCGRGGSGGGVPSREGVEMPLTEALRDMLFMMFSVGFAKSWCTTSSAFFAEP